MSRDDSISTVLNHDNSADNSEMSDLIGVMRRQEDALRSTCPNTDYLRICEVPSPMDITDEDMEGSSSSLKRDPSSTALHALDEAAKSRPAVDETCRVKMTEWFYQVVDYCKLRRETVSYTMSYLDRFLSAAVTSGLSQYLRDRTMFQLASVTCFYLAIKIHEPIEIEMGLLSILSRGVYTEAQISDMEKRVLFALNWKMYPPIASAFVDHFLPLLPPSAGGEEDPAEVDIFELSRYQVELSVIDYSVATQYRPSVVAAAAMLNAVDHACCIGHLSSRQREAFMRNIDLVATMDCRSKDVLEVRQTLLSAFARSRGYELLGANLSVPEDSLSSNKATSQQRPHTIAPTVSSHDEDRAVGMALDSDTVSSKDDGRFVGTTSESSPVSVVACSRMSSAAASPPAATGLGSSPWHRKVHQQWDER